MRDSRWHAPTLVRISVAVHAAALAAIILNPGLWCWTLAAVLLNHLVIAAVGLWPRSRWLGPNLTQLPAAAAARKEIALTIDDGPDPAVTPQVLDLLDRYAAKASFFCVGAKAERYPALCREIVRRGHAVENHSQHHRHHFSLMGFKAIEEEIKTAQDTLTAISGQCPAFFRPPAGLRNPFLEPVLAKLGLTLATWSVRGFDTRTHDATLVVKRLQRGLQAGAILLVHDGNAARTTDDQPVILSVLPAILELARARGFKAVTLREAML